MSVSSSITRQQRRPVGGNATVPAPAMHLCEYTIKDGAAAWWIIHRSPYNEGITLAEYLSLVRVIVSAFPCQRCQKHPIDTTIIATFRDGWINNSNKLDMENELLDDVCMWAFNLHNTISIAKEKTIACISTESHQWINMTTCNRSEVLTALRAKYATTDNECSSR